MTAPALSDLGVLLTDGLPLSDAPLIICDAELNAPLRYVFESDGEVGNILESWIEAIGASRQLAGLPNQISAALPPGSVILQADGGRVLALVPASAASGWMARLSRLPPDVTGIVTLSVGSVRVTVRQIFEGLYRSPENVIGIPGMTVHQSRVNRYYHVESQSTVPPPDRITARRHFGEVVGLVRHLAKRAHEEQLPIPFYECLPVVERCVACQSRPAEPGPSNRPLCGICQRKRQAAGPLDRVRWAAVIGVRLPITDTFVERSFRLLLNQQTPGAYQRMAEAIAEGWHYALFETEKCGPGVKVAWQSDTEAWLVAPATEALPSARTLCRALAASKIVESGSLCVGIALGDAGARTVHAIAQAALSDAVADAERSGNPGVVRIRLVDEFSAYETVPDTNGLRYSLDTLDRLHTAATDLAVQHFPTDAFSELPDVLVRQTAQAAALYFDHSRTRLDDRARRLLDPIASNFGSIWGTGTARFFRAMADVFGLQALMQQAMLL